MPNISILPILILAVLALASDATRLGAQEAPPPHERGRSVKDALAAWRAGDDTGEKAILKILLNPPGYTAATVDSALDGTARLALAAPGGIVRHRAASFLASAGSTLYTESPRPGVVGRARAIYESSGDRVVRGIIVRRMAEQAERPEAIAFLEGVVLEGDKLTDGFDQSAVHIAIAALHRMGADGDEALRQAHATGRMGSAGAEYLEYLGVIPKRP